MPDVPGGPAGGVPDGGVPDGGVLDGGVLDGGVLDGVRGRTALVTGAGNGLGRAIALALGDCGVRVIASGRTRANLEETARLLTARGAACRIAPADVADPGSVAALASAIAGEDLSIVVNCAGVAGPVKPLTEIEPDEWDAVFAANVRGTYLVCRALIPALLAHGSGDIINIASVSGKRPLAMRTPYTASKMAVIGLTTTLGAEVGPLGIRVNSLSPGPVRGPRMERNFRLEAARLGITEQEAETAFASRAALGRLLDEDEVGRAVVAMLMMTGLHCADIDLSAGMVAR